MAQDNTWFIDPTDPPASPTPPHVPPLPGGCAHSRDTFYVFRFTFPIFYLIPYPSPFLLLTPLHLTPHIFLLPVRGEDALELRLLWCGTTTPTRIVPAQAGTCRE